MTVLKMQRLLEVFVVVKFNLTMPVVSCPQCGSSSFHQGHCLACHYATPIAIKLRRQRIAEQLKGAKARKQALA